MEKQTEDPFAGKEQRDVRVVGYRGQWRKGRGWGFGFGFAGIKIQWIVRICIADLVNVLILNQQISSYSFLLINKLTNSLSLSSNLSLLICSVVIAYSFHIFLTTLSFFFFFPQFNLPLPPTSLSCPSHYTFLRFSLVISPLSFLPPLSFSFSLNLSTRGFFSTILMRFHMHLDLMWMVFGISV